jgi:rhodanese-related sulfurtransferase
MAKRRRIYGYATVSPAYLKLRAGQRNKLTVWWVGLGIGIVLLVGGAWLLFRPAPVLPAEISPMQAFEEYREGALFLDVRSAAEWNQGHIQDTVLIPLHELPARLSELPRDRDIVVVCQSGGRSQQGAAILRAAGFTRVASLSGGLQDWIAAGYPLGD